VAPAWQAVGEAARRRSTIPTTALVFARPTALFSQPAYQELLLHVFLTPLLFCPVHRPLLPSSQVSSSQVHTASSACCTSLCCGAKCICLPRLAVFIIAGPPDVPSVARHSPDMSSARLCLVLPVLVHFICP
jgi:hypothetical protein